jgi:AcrR family transcriptional regulator
VGVGTVYRRFPDKDALIEALFEEKIERVVALADAALEIEDPGEGFFTFMRGMCRMQAEDRGFKDALLGRDRGRERVAAARGRIAPRAMKLLARAQEAGAVRSDLGPFDVPMLHLCVGLIADRTRDVAPAYWERLLAILLDGLSADGAATPLPGEPIDREAFTRAMAGAHRRRA